MPFNQVNKIVDAATTECQKAYENLISEGVSPIDAEQRVKVNFNRVNNNPNLILTVDELCK